MGSLSTAILSVLVSMALQGCVPRVAIRGSYVYFDPSAPIVGPTRSPAQVEVFYQREPSLPIEEIGIVEAVARGWKVSLKDLLPELQRQAAIMGSDGIHKIDIRRYDHDGEAMHATAVGIRFTGPAR